ncbi:MAG: hypothetical protein DNFNHJIP_00091 [Candidatus Argoarchaeum ethanivorans]|uniref:SMP-30/Gluconolactonase/LRE-like region domain-containing protein n=1 Tax=Candidatus Argoarchaeum ethanivorans TaxID=2608793 RepID=A0A812A275_9EURY|nr:MAG: hypothetical protein DNFNHJIP_00091 [Candidatus Argoarchaeum ethanivorans]
MKNEKKGIGIFIAAIVVISVFASITGLASAMLLPPSQTGNLFVLEEGSDDVISITPTGQVSDVLTEDEIGTFTGEGSADFDNCGIAFDDFGNLFFAEEDSESILKWTPGAGLSWVVTKAQITAATGETLADPEGIAFGSDGFLYVNDDASESVLQVDTTTNTVSVYVSKATLEALPGITSVDLNSPIVGGPGGVVYTASDGTPDAIFAIAPGGVPSVLTSNPIFSDLDVFMTRAPDGDLIICDNSGGDIIHRVDPSTGAVSTFLTEAQILAAIGDPGQTDVDLEGGIAFDSQGYFYLAEEDSDNILKFDSAGNGQIWVSNSTMNSVTGVTPDLEAGIAFAAPAAAVPTLTPIGIIALVGLLSVIAAMSIKTRKRRR